MAGRFPAVQSRAGNLFDCRVVVLLQKLLASGPLIFRLWNHDKKVSTHCGVLEFTADSPKSIYVPRWCVDLVEGKQSA
jgi:hypothetical protein